MGLNDRIDSITGHESGGFDPDVCEGCRHHGEGECGFCGKEDCDHDPCGLCTCPTVSNFPMDLTGKPPKDCPRIEEHHERGDSLL